MRAELTSCIAEKAQWIFEKFSGAQFVIRLQTFSFLETSVCCGVNWWITVRVYTQNIKLGFFLIALLQFLNNCLCYFDIFIIHLNLFLNTRIFDTNKSEEMLKQNIFRWTESAIEILSGDNSTQLSPRKLFRVIFSDNVEASGSL